MMTNNRQFWANIEIAFRVYLFVMLSIYGWGKLFGDQFFQAGRIPPDIAAKRLDVATLHDIAWVFFGASYFYQCFIGISQGIAAFLLLFNRTKIISIAMLFPIMTNVIVVDICYGVSPGPLWSSLLYTSMIGFIVLYNWEQIKKVLQLMMGIPVESKIEYHQTPQPKLFIVFLAIVATAMLEIGVFILLHHFVRATKDFWFD